MQKKIIITTYIILSTLYAVAIFADFISIYRYDQQDRIHSFQPPSPIRFDIKQKKFYTYGYNLVDKTLKTYELDKTKKSYIKFFALGYEYRFLFFKINLHLLKTEDEVRFNLLGTDKHGRDVFSRIIRASRVSLSIGLIGVLITFVLGMIIGGFSGYVGGRADFVIMRVCEMIMCFPFFYLMLALRAALPLNMSPVKIYLCIIVIFSLIGWPSFARVIRGMVMSIKTRDYIEHARIIGVPKFRIIWRHILPNTLSYALVSAFLSIPSYILGEAGLSFIGLGIQEPEPSWGNMLSSAMNVRVLSSFPWVLAAGLCIFVTVVSFNVIGDHLRDKFDPRLSGGHR